MDKIDWKKKLSSRKFWAALATMGAGLALLFRADKNLADQVSGCILMFGACVTYIVTEGKSDAADLSGDVTINYNGIPSFDEDESDEPDGPDEPDNPEE